MKAIISEKGAGLSKNEQAILTVCLCIAQYIFAERPSMCKGSVVEGVVLGQAECLEERGRWRLVGHRVGWGECGLTVGLMGRVSTWWGSALCFKRTWSAV